jgi:hypothetical protein
MTASGSKDIGLHRHALGGGDFEAVGPGSRYRVLRALWVAAPIASAKDDLQVRLPTACARLHRAFRIDVATGWLVTTCLAMIHAAAEEVRSGELESNAALDLLSATITDLLTRPHV